MEGPNRTDEIATLISRLELLDRLCQSPAHIRDIIDETGQARSTAHRAVNELTQLGLVHRGEDGNEATLTGQLVRDQLVAYLDGLDDILTVQSVLEPLPADTDIEFGALNGAEGILSVDPAPYRPSDRIHDDLTEASAYRTLFPTLEESRTIRVLYEHVVTQGNSAELVVSPAVFQTLRDDFPRRMTILAEQDQFTVLVGDVPPYGLGLLERDTGSGSPVSKMAHLVVHNDNGSVHGLVVNESERGVSWATAQYEKHRDDATDRTSELVADSDGSIQTVNTDTASLIGQSLPAPLEREGFVRVDADYFQTEPVAAPETAWRAGLSLAEVHTGYAIEREVTAKEENRADDRITANLATALTSGSSCILVGQPGSGKSTVCKQIACEWYDAGRGAVLYREGARGRTFRSVEDLILTATAQDGDTLVVVEDAVRPDAEAIFDALDRLADEDVSVLLDAREHEWSEFSRQSVELQSLDVVHVPSVSQSDCERLVDHFERTLGKSVNVSSEQLWTAVREEATTANSSHEMLRLIHRLATYADPVGDGPTALEEAVASVYDEIADDELTLSVGLLVSTLNAAGIGVDRGLLYAVAGEGEFAAVDAALETLEGQMLFPQENESYRTVHEEWSVAFLVHFLEAVGPETAAREFGEVVTELLALADDAERCEKISQSLDERELIDEAERWADETGEAIYERGKELSKLALLFGDGTDDTITLPDACSSAVVANRPVWLGQVFLAGAYYDRAERAFERVPQDGRERSIERLLGLAQISTERGEYDEAVEYCKECLERLEDGSWPTESAPVTRARVRLQFGDALGSYNQFAEAEEQFQAVLDELSAAKQPGLTAQAFSKIGTMASKQGNYERARECFESSLELTRDRGDRRAEADVLNSFGTVPWVQGETDEAHTLFQQALELREAVGDRHGEAKSLYNIGIAMRRQANYEQAREYLERSLELLNQVGDNHTEVTAHGALGLVLMKQGEYERARDLFEQWLEHSRELGDPHDEAQALNNLGILANRQGEYERASNAFEQSLERKEEVGDSRGVARTLTNLGQVMVLQGRFDRAKELFERSLEGKEQFEGSSEMASTINSLGVVAVRESEFDRAVEYFTRGLDAAEDANEASNVAVAHNGLAEVAIQREEYETAREHVNRAVDAVAGEETTLEAEFQLTRGRLLLAGGEFDDARKYANESLQEFEGRNSKHWRGRARRLLGRIAADAGEEELAREELFAALTIFEEIKAYHDADETLNRLADTVSDAALIEQCDDRATELFSTAPEEVRERYSRWLDKEQ